MGNKQIKVLYHCDVPECPATALQGEDAGWKHGKYDYCPDHVDLAA